MISQLGRYRAASVAAAFAIAAVSEKLPAEIAPTPHSRAAASIASKSPAVSPDVPITTATPRSIAASAFAFATSWEVKSIITSTPSSASATEGYTGAPWSSLPAAERLTAERRSRSSAAAIASAIAAPVQPVAPATQMLRLGTVADDASRRGTHATALRQYQAAGGEHARRDHRGDLPVDARATVVGRQLGRRHVVDAGVAAGQRRVPRRLRLVPALGAANVRVRRPELELRRVGERLGAGDREEAGDDGDRRAPRAPPGGAGLGDGEGVHCRTVRDGACNAPTRR